ncbi:NUDIX hydrolase [Propionicicella superfundia]|uniref:NUDIX hydrolase n=1 Tax=Propionicicella superfundia TaxID=348582 RepID=UPI00049158CE|nr:NUDIX domain-containing protein [Propionicicella superfundia]
MDVTEPPYRDGSGRTLEDYPRPSVAVDTAVLTVHEGRLCVLLVRGDAARERLPGTFLHPRETLREAALRALHEKAAVEGLAPRQLRVFDSPTRDDRGWVLSVAHVDAVRADRIRLTAHTRLVAVDEHPALAYDHTEIVAHAATTLRRQYRGQPDPWHLLPHSGDGLTIRDLRLLHEAVLGERLVADTFRRTMLPHLVPTGERRRGARGKPAELFRRTDAPESRSPADR